MADLNLILRKAEFSLRRLTWQTQLGISIASNGVFIGNWANG